MPAPSIREMMMTRIPLHTAIHQCRQAADNAADRLDRIAYALDVVGMGKLAKDLRHIAEQVVVGPHQISEAYNAHMTEQVNHSEAMMGNLLKATLAGCIVPPTEARQP